MFSYVDNINKDKVIRNKDEWLELAKDWVDPFGKPEVFMHEGVYVVRDDLITGGTKSRAAHHVLNNIEKETVVYVVPRVGLAGVALLEANKWIGKKIIFFMPASKECSDIQAYCYERAYKTYFYRIAAMPNLNRLAKIYADESNSEFIPLGLYNKYSIAALVKTIDSLKTELEKTKGIYYAMSTGVLGRSIEIALSEKKRYAVAVARNIKEGEKGDAEFISYPKCFSSKVPIQYLPPFPSVKTYDAKVWSYVPKGYSMWNVGTDLKLTGQKERINSYKEW